MMHGIHETVVWADCLRLASGSGAPHTLTHTPLRTPTCDVRSGRRKAKSRCSPLTDEDPVLSIRYFPPASGISTNLESGNRVRVSLRLRACRVRALGSITTVCRSSSNSKPLAVGDCERAHNGVNDVADGPATS